MIGRVSAKFGYFLGIFDKFFIFCLVGLCGTATQYATLWVGVYLLHGYAFISSGLGYLFGSIVNYYLNHVVTFGKDRSQRKHLVAVSRFYIANGISWSINTALMGLLVDMAGYNTWFSQIFATGVCLFWNYFAARFWVYKT